MRRNSKLSTLGIVQRVLLVIGFLAMEFPGVLFFKDIADPRLFGLPFAYGFMLIGWIYMCVVLFWAYMTNWGEPVAKSEGGESK